jgi:DNA-binding response OmpR family regulator
MRRSNSTPAGSYNGLVISDDARAKERSVRLLRGFTRNVAAVALADAVRTIAFRTVHLVVLDAGERTNEFLAVLERFGTQGKHLAVLALVAASDLSRVRLPRRLHGDFMLRGGQGAHTINEVEFIARLRRLTATREQTGEEETLTDGALTLDKVQRRAYLNGEALTLAYIEYELLAFFLTHPNRTYSREELLQRVWGIGESAGEDVQTSDYSAGASAPSRTVDVHVRRIRAKLGALAQVQLETVRGSGYLWKQSTG